MSTNALKRPALSSLHGWLVLDKPLGLSSAQAVGKAKWLCMEHLRAEARKADLPAPSAKKALKIGHGGTLDPLASGILPLALGEATKTVQFAMDAAKTYCFTLRWGEQRSTDDAEGEIIASSDIRPSREQIEALLPNFIGPIQQTPPIYSAIKVDGKRAYAMARAGEEVVLEPRPVIIHHIEIDGFSKEEARFTVYCGKGTYIRSLARDIATSAGAYGYVSLLSRIAVGNFNKNNAISLEKLEEIVHNGHLATLLHPVEAVLDDIPAQEISPPLAQRLRQGQTVFMPQSMTQDGLVRVHCKNVLIAMCNAEKGTLKPVRVFNYQE